MSESWQPAGARGDEALLQALARGVSVKAAAAEAGVSVRTVYRRLANPGFQKRLTALRDELITSALGELVGCAASAVHTLEELLSERDARIRLGAVRLVLEQVLKLREALTLEQRLQALERNAALAKRKGR